MQSAAYTRQEKIRFAIYSLSILHKSHAQDIETKMTNWTSGYVADIGYTYGYYAELNPLRVRLAFLNNGLAAPDIVSACELGFGQGLSINMHAAASNVHWYGTDFNPAHASFAQELATASKADTRLMDDSFEEFAQRPDIPDFDYIGIHGIWSWINDENRQRIVDFVHHKLKPGGVLYISYNTLPGFDSFAPMRHLMTLHAEVIGSHGQGLVSRIDDAVDFACSLQDANSLYVKANPLVAARLAKLKHQDRHYLAHEYFNRDWHPMYFSTMADYLKSAKLDYACSARYLDHVDAINLTPDQQAILKSIPDPMFRQSTFDFMVNRHFRTDYWVKGKRPINSVAQIAQLRKHALLLTTLPSNISLEINSPAGKTRLSEKIYGAILDALTGCRVMTLGQLEDIVKPKGISFSQLMQACFVLMGQDHLHPVMDANEATKSRKCTDRLNAYLLSRAGGNGYIYYLASPVTGGGFAVSRLEQLFLQAIYRGERMPVEWSEHAKVVLKAHQETHGGFEFPDLKEFALNDLTREAEHFARHRLPVLKALQIV